MSENQYEKPYSYETVIETINEDYKPTKFGCASCEEGPCLLTLFETTPDDVCILNKTKEADWIEE